MLKDSTGTLDNPIFVVYDQHTNPYVPVVYVGPSLIDAVRAYNGSNSVVQISIWLNGKCIGTSAIRREDIGV